MYNYYILRDNSPPSDSLVRKLEEVIGGDEIVTIVKLKESRILVVTKDGPDHLRSSLNMTEVMSKIKGDLDENT